MLGVFNRGIQQCINAQSLHFFSNLATLCPHEVEN